MDCDSSPPLYNQARTTSNPILHLPTLEPEERSMRISVTSTIDRRKDSGSEGGAGGEMLSSGKGNSSSGDGLRISDAGSSSKDNNKATAASKDGESSIGVGGEHIEESNDDGETINPMYGTG